MKQKIGLISTFEHRVNTLVTKEEDKKKEMKHVRKALKRCGHPRWSLHRTKRTNPKEERTERRGKVVLPYVRGISENLARIFKRYDLETIHKPSSTLKNLLCNKMKDQVDILDRTGSVYHLECLKRECRLVRDKDDYTGETDRVTRERMYEHRIIDHKTSKEYASLKIPEEKKVQAPLDPAGGAIRRSSRVKNKVDYKAMQEMKNQQLTPGNTDFSAHVATDIHDKKDLKFSVICTEENWFKRGVKEAIAIKKLKPTLNKDQGRYHLSPIYDELIRTSVEMKTSSSGAKGGSEERNL